MSLPNDRANSEILAVYSEQLAPWCKKYASVLALEVGSSRTLDKECLNHASNLRSTQETWERETQEDKLAVTERNTLLGSVQTLIPSLRAFVQYHLRDHPEPARVLSDFAFSSPSELRTEKSGA